ncbi:MAG: hypothetical protein K0S91_1802 [Nitrososphaeraceae archaeon]|nr:hypothetical protein [Nitrososphaeraceae archaeon]
MLFTHRSINLALFSSILNYRELTESYIQNYTHEIMTYYGRQ